MDKRAFFILGALLASAFLFGRFTASVDLSKKEQSIDIEQSSASSDVKKDIIKTEIIKPNGTKIIKTELKTENSSDRINVKTQHVESELKERKGSGIGLDALGIFSLNDFKIHPGLSISSNMFFLRGSAGFIPSYNGGTVLLSIGVQL